MGEAKKSLYLHICAAGGKSTFWMGRSIFPSVLKSEAAGSECNRVPSCWHRWGLASTPQPGCASKSRMRAQEGIPTGGKLPPCFPFSLLFLNLLPAGQIKVGSTFFSPEHIKGRKTAPLSPAEEFQDLILITARLTQKNRFGSIKRP